MKFVTSLFLFFAFVQSAQAAQKNVDVQCTIAGPVYPGNLDFEETLANWKPASECKAISNIESSQTLSVPEFTLKFNSLTYTGKAGETIHAYLWGKTCDWSNFSQEDKTIRFKIIEQVSGMELDVKAPITAPGKFPDRFTISNKTEICAISTH